MRKVFGNRSRSAVVSCAAAAIAAVSGGCALAQDYPLEAQMKFEAWNGAAWVRDVTVAPGARVEWRIRIDYTGPRTDLFAIGAVLYQPIVSNADNIGTDEDRDNFGPFRLGGSSGPGSILSTQEGNNPTENPNGYGRVNFGGFVNSTSSSNILTAYRHSAGSGGAPPGEWMRIAGSATSPAWPVLGPGTIPTTSRSVSSQQVSLALTNPADLHIAGVHDITIFRMQLDLADSNIAERQVVLTSPLAALKRAGGPTSTDDRRYMSFQINSTDNGGYRTMVEFLPLTITVIPAPGALAPLAGLLFCCSRRTRKGSRP